MTDDKEYTPVNQSQDQNYKNLSLVTVIMMFDAVLFFAAGLFCLMKPEAVDRFLGLGLENTTYFGYALIAVSIFTFIGTRFLAKRRDK